MNPVGHYDSLNVAIAANLRLRARKYATVYIFKANLAPLQCPTHQCHAVIGFSLGQNIADVVVYGTLADVKIFGDLLIR